MGNCMEKSAASQAMQKVKEPEERLMQGSGGDLVAKEGGFKVKILLTRGELEWLVVQLKKGERRLEDVLMEMGKEVNRDKSKALGWKPSLESIVEGSEVQNFD
ncbi:uncharacterized protein [Typha latifolia]|uniref:uncharacterized protein n=1 Tax=Typha latifolia TaxID=4733 RepID=UPI003C2C7CCB